MQRDPLRVPVDLWLATQAGGLHGLHVEVDEDDESGPVRTAVRIFSGSSFKA